LKKKEITSNDNVSAQSKEMGMMVKRLKEENVKLNNEVKKLVEEISVLEYRVGKVEYNVKTTKVLHLKSNPTSSLCNNNDNNKNNNYHNMNNDDEDMSLTLPNVNRRQNDDLKRLLEEKELMEKQLEENVKSKKRLMEIFQKKIIEFREAVYQMFGYKMEFFCGG